MGLAIKDLLACLEDERQIGEKQEQMHRPE
jgi:hypothetical protein